MAGFDGINGFDGRSAGLVDYAPRKTIEGMVSADSLGTDCASISSSAETDSSSHWVIPTPIEYLNCLYEALSPVWIYESEGKTCVSLRVPPVITMVPMTICGAVYKGFSSIISIL